MTPERWQQVRALLRAALGREARERPAFLEAACAGDADLRGEVESLLASHERMGGFLDAPALEGAAPWPVDDGMESTAGRRIGPYQVVREVGRGGMGAVYLAERTDGIRKQVAIKVIKRDMDTDAIVRRFRHEQQILATLDHPNMARFLDAGMTEDDLPYYIMDYVEGLPLDVYCDRQKLPTVERLTLFRTVCSAVQYAHEHQVVHRDLKPSNILVTPDGSPKLLDFGIAKVLDAEAAGPTTVSTAAGLRPMTPEYASPEQVQGEPITPASDVYSLGVLLYELLTGQRPYRLQTRTAEERARVIGEEEPDRQNTAIRRLEEVPGANGGAPVGITPESVHAAREGQPEKRRRRLAGDLHNIVLMALRKEPGRRYASVAAFSEDLRRHLEGLPVIARKDTLWYRGTKFIQRNKAAVLAATLTVVVLLAMVMVGFHLYLQRDQATDRAVDSVAILPFVNANADPNTEYLSDGISESLINSLSQLPKLRVIASSAVVRYKGQNVDPQTVGRELKVRAVLMGRVLQPDDRLTITTELVDVANGSRLWGEQYNRKVGDILTVQEEIAKDITEKLRLRLTGAERQLLAKRDTEKPAAYREYLMGQHFKNQRTAAGLKRGLQHFERAIALDPSYAPAHAGMAESYVSMATWRVLSPRDAHLKARTAAVKALDLDPALSEPHAILAVVSFYYEWDWATAEPEFTRAIQLKPDNANVHFRYALALSWFDRFAEALREIARARELDPLSLLINANVGLTQYWARRYDQAIEELHKALALDANYFPAHQWLGWAYVQTRAYDEAIAAFKKAMDLEGGSQVEADLAHVYAASGRTGEARRILNDLQNRSTRTYISAFDIAIVYAGLGDHDQAFAWLEKAYDERARHDVAQSQPQARSAPRGPRIYGPAAARRPPTVEDWRIGVLSGILKLIVTTQASFCHLPDKG